MGVAVEENIGLREGEGVGFGDVAFDAGDARFDEVGDERLSAFGGFECAGTGGDERFADCSGEEFDVFVSFAVECAIVAAPVDIAHERFFGSLEFIGFIEDGGKSALLEAIGRSGHEGLELTVATAFAVAGFVEEEWAGRGFGGERIIDEFFCVFGGVTDEPCD